MKVWMYKGLEVNHYYACMLHKSSILWLPFACRMSIILRDACVHACDSVQSTVPCKICEGNSRHIKIAYFLLIFRSEKAFL